MTASCPLPEVEVALAPYIRTRQEALLVRQRLTAYLRSHVHHTSGVEVTHLDLTCPPSTLEAKAVPNDASGLRRQYLEALEAHTAAQKRRDALQDELTEMRNEHVEAQSGVSRDMDIQEGMANHTALLRQRKRLSRLQILSAGVDELVENAPELTRRDLKSLIEDEVGSSPDPPSLTLEVETQDPKVEELTFQLKKELILAKRSLTNVTRRKEKAESNLKQFGTPSVQAEVTSLRNSRDELVSWIEGELAKIGEESEMFDSSPQKPSQEDETVGLDTYHEQIQVLYDVYLDRRKDFVTLVDNATLELNKPRSDKEMRQQQPRQSMLPLNQVDSQEPKVSELISFMPSLLAISRTEDDLQQQITYLRRQVTSASEESLTTLKRLADESHMVPPRSEKAQAWVEAARESKRDTEDIVEKHLLLGEESVQKAQTILKDLGERQENFLKVKGQV